MVIIIINILTFILILTFIISEAVPTTQFYPLVAMRKLF